MIDKQIPIVVITCKVFQGILERYLPPDLADRVSFLDYVLHRNPKKLTRTLQEQISSIKKPSLIRLGYGLCKNLLDDVQSGPHTLLIRRADDCIAILLGSHQA